ncbi:MAG: usg protein [Bauldia sp.]
MEPDGHKWQLAGFGLTTASILYRMPDHPAVLQTFVWQEYDLAPEFPELRRFLDFWRRELEGPLHSVTVAHKLFLTPAEVRMVSTEIRLH